MYNEYYLQEINSKMGQLNALQDDIIDNQEEIIAYQQELVSGEIAINENLKEIQNENIMLVMIFAMYLLMYFIVRCLK